VNGKDTVLEKLEEEIVKVFRIINDREKKNMINNSEEVVKEWRATILDEEELMFSLDVE
jgi:hypothetical protein